MLIMLPYFGYFLVCVSMIANVYFFDEVQPLIFIAGISSLHQVNDLLIWDILTPNGQM